MSLSYWDFINILNTRNEIMMRKAGKSVVKDKVPQSNKDMIQRLKDKHGK